MPVTGRETTGEFRDLKFQSQIDAIAEDLRANFWYEDSKVIANSFGAYLFLHAQAQLEPYIGKVMLLSPIVGEFENEGIGRRFIPPRANRLFELARSGSYPTPKHCAIHVGSEDGQRRPGRADRGTPSQISQQHRRAGPSGHQTGDQADA